jgi:class 3 adenylate cyclase
MALIDDLKTEVQSTFASAWTEDAAAAVPAPAALRLNANHAKHLDSATVLYADLDGSTNMVDALSWQSAAEVYKVYLRCASKIIKNEAGVITAYDGDRVMAVFTGNTKNTSAVTAALKINYAVEQIIRPAYAKQYSGSPFVVRHVVGIDTSALRAARIGVVGDNDLVWIGRAANYAAKLCNISEKPLWITKAVYDRLMDSAKLSGTANMWQKRSWTSMNNMEIYCSTYRQSF